MTEPHSPHSGQRPTHLGGWWPQASHSYAGRGSRAAARPRPDRPDGAGRGRSGGGHPRTLTDARSDENTAGVAVATPAVSSTCVCGSAVAGRRAALVAALAGDDRRGRRPGSAARRRGRGRDRLAVAEVEGQVDLLAGAQLPRSGRSSWRRWPRLAVELGVADGPGSRSGPAGRPVAERLGRGGRAGRGGPAGGRSTGSARRSGRDAARRRGRRRLAVGDAGRAADRAPLGAAPASTISRALSVLTVTVTGSGVSL